MSSTKHKWLELPFLGGSASRLKCHHIVLSIVSICVLSPSLVNCFRGCPNEQLLSTLVSRPNRTDSVTGQPCECTNIQEGGWEVTCFGEPVPFDPSEPSEDYHVVPSAFFIRFEIGRQVKIICDTGVPSFRPALFQGFGIESIDAFSLENCPLPHSLPLSVILHRASSAPSTQPKPPKPGSESHSESHNGLDSQSPEISKVRSLSIVSKNAVSLQQLSNLLAGLEPLEQLKLSQFMITDFANLTAAAAAEHSDLTNDTISANNTNANSKPVFDESLFRFAENLPNLKSLKLHSFITDEAPDVLFDMLEGLTRLTYLELDSNSLSGLPKATFAYASGLETLYLYRNQINTLDANAFANLSQLQILDISNNRLTDLPHDLFKDLKNLNYLSIKNNVLSKLPENLFRHNTKLISLDLSSNRDLKTFPTHLLKGLQTLTNFTAEDCHLTSLSRNPQTFFRNAPKLESVRVRGNLLTNLTINGLFGGNGKLKKLDFAYNNISQISRDIFGSNSSQITELNLYGNEIEVIPENMFVKLRSLRKLNLGFNQLRQTDPHLFLPLQALEELNLSKNQLVTINSQVNLIPFGLGNVLRKVNLANNRLSDFSKDFNSINWSLYLNIAELDLRNNSFVGVLRVPVFSSSIAPIINLDLSHNRFTSIDIQAIANYDRYAMSEEKTSDGTRRTRDSNAITTNIYETHIRLDNNPIECDCFLEPFLSYVKKSHQTYQSRSSNIYRKSIFLIESEDLMCDKPDHLKHQTLNMLELSQLICPIDDKNICPSSCQCVYQSTDMTAVIDCNDRRLTSLPQELQLSRFHNISLEHKSNARIESVKGVVVQLKNNRIQDIETINRMFIWDNKLVRKPSFVEIYLDNNSISVVHEDIIPQFYPFKNSSLPLIRRLSLRDNQITSLPMTVLKNFDSFASHLSDNAMAEPKLFLGNNPYDCHNEKALPGSVCPVGDFKMWLTKHSERIGDIKTIVCDKTEYNSSAIIVEMPDHELCPILESGANDTLLLALSITCIILAISLLIVSVLYYRNKQTILAFIYIHFNPVFICLSFSEEDLDEDKVYDAFVSYSSADRDVVMSLIEKLERPNHEANMILHNTTGASIHEGHTDQIIPENEFKKSQMNLSVTHSLNQNGADNCDPNSEQYYKLCIHERDWLPGNLISWNIVNSVQNSKRTILVLSKDFIESIWFQVEFHTAYYQMLEDKIDRLIVVVRGQLPPKEQLDKDLVFLLTTKTYLVWGEKWFWEKLRYALPHKKKISNNLKSSDIKSDKTVKSIQSNGVTNSMKNVSKNNSNNKSSEVMKSYVDKTIANHFQLNSYPNPNPTTAVANNAKTVTAGPKSLRNSSSMSTQNDSRMRNGFENQSFVVESHT